MSFMDKLRNTLQGLSGAAKQRTGEAAGDRDLAARGRADRAKADTKQAGEHVKDAASDVKDSAKDAFGR